MSNTNIAPDVNQFQDLFNEFGRNPDFVKRQRQAEEFSMTTNSQLMMMEDDFNDSVSL